MLFQFLPNVLVALEYIFLENGTFKFRNVSANDDRQDAER
jgi:hypothetical protein